MQTRLNIDIETWEACKPGDQTVYAFVYKKYYSGLHVYGSRFTKDTTLVENCIQEIFTNFWINRKNFATVNTFQSYLFVSFRNMLIRNLQRRDVFLTKALVENNYDFQLELAADHVMIDAEKMFE